MHCSFLLTMLYLWRLFEISLYNWKYSPLFLLFELTVSVQVQSGFLPIFSGLKWFYVFLKLCYSFIYPSTGHTMCIWHLPDWKGCVCAVWRVATGRRAKCKHSTNCGSSLCGRLSEALLSYWFYPDLWPIFTLGQGEGHLDTVVPLST